MRPARTAAWLGRQPPSRRRLYGALLAVTLLTIPCYVTGFLLLALGSQPAPPQPPTPTATMTAQPVPREEITVAPPFATETPRAAPIEPSDTPTLEVSIVTATATPTSDFIPSATFTDPPTATSAPPIILPTLTPLPPSTATEAPTPAITVVPTVPGGIVTLTPPP